MSRLLGVLLLLCSAVSQADSLTVAVAANFTQTLEILVKDYQQQHRDRIRIVSGSTGKLYAQIKQGAPFDIFLAADRARPQRLLQDGLLQEQHLMVYALGRLVLWRPGARQVNARSLAQALQDPQTRLAIANPRLAPYGLAAQQVLQRMGLEQAWRGRLVYGENISQVLHFVHSGNVRMGLLAYAQRLPVSPGNQHEYWLVPAELHDPIEQAAVLLRSRPASDRFWHYLQSPRATQLIRQQGYDLPAQVGDADGE